MKILLLSPYHAKSHQTWCEGLMANIQADWTLLTLSPRYFSWRIRGNSLSWGFSKKSILQQHFDLVIATSMTDLNGLVGFVPALGKVPSMLYFHENQFAYPVSEFARDNIEPKIVPLYAALTADHLCFNTQYNYRTFVHGAEELLRRMPDNVPSGLFEKIQVKSSVLPVPINPAYFQVQDNNTHQVFTLVWNHRWEYDKWPECFFQALSILVDKKLKFELHVLGEQFKNKPAVFEKAETQFSAHIKSWGRVESDEEYRKILSASHVVVSTALHDFQGLAILEGVAAGCVPVVPDRLAYCELFTDKYRYASHSKNIEVQAQCLAEHILTLAISFYHDEWQAAPNVRYLSWLNQKEKYQELIIKIAGDK